MMKVNLKLLLFSLLLAASGVFAVTTKDIKITTPSNGYLTLTKPSNTVYTYDIHFSNANKTLNYTCKLYSEDQSIANVVILQPTYTSFKVFAGKSASIPVTIIFPESKDVVTYNGKVVFYCSAVKNNTSYISIPTLVVTLTDNPWVYKNTTTVKYPVTVYYNNYKFYISKAVNGVSINGVDVVPGVPKYFYNYKFKILVKYIDPKNDIVTFEVYSRISNPYVRIVHPKSAKKNETVNVTKTSSGEIDLYPTNINVRLQQGVKSYSTVLYLYNGLNKPITIQRVIPIGDEYEFSDGTSEPVTNVKVPYNTVQPGDQIPIVVQMSSTKLQPGRYTITINVFYMYDNKLHIKSSVLNIYVFQSQSVSKKKLSIKLPDKLEYNKKFKVIVTGLGFDNKVNFSISPRSCVEGGYNRSENSFVYVGTVKCTKPISITVSVYKNKVLLQSISKQYLVENPKKKKPTNNNNVNIPKILRIVVNPPNPKPGDVVTIKVVGANGTVINGATVLVNGVKENSFVAKPKTTYTIVAMANGYQQATTTIHIPGKAMKVVIQPKKETYKVGDVISVYAYDPKTNESLPITIKVNGKVYNSNVIHLDKEGHYTITISYDDYQTVTRTINVIKPLQVFIPKKATSGKTVTISANKNVTWIIKYVNPKTNETYVVFSTSEPKSTISFTPKKPGKYIIEAGNKRFVMAVSPNYIETAGELTGKLILALIVLAILYFIFKRVRGRRKKVSHIDRVGFKPPSVIRERGVVSGLKAEPLSEEEKPEE